MAARRVDRWALTFCLLYTLLCQFATNSLRATIGDATLFAYGGRLVLSGYIPYRDFWDNKPPLIFYIEALGYRLFGTTWLGPTALQALVYLASVVAFGWLARKLHPLSAARRAAFLGLVTFGINLPGLVMDGANLTETYLLLPVAVCLGLLDPFGVRPRRWAWYLAGAVAGVAFLLRPNAVGLGVLALVTLGLHSGLLQTWSLRVRGMLLLTFFLGGLTPLLLATGYFAAHGAASEMWFATVVYNVTAYNELFLLRASLFEVERYYMFKDEFGIAALLAAGAGGVAVTLANYARLPAIRARRKLAGVVFGLTWFAADLALVAVTGHPYAHYIIMLFPAAAYLASSCFDTDFLRRAASPGSALVEVAVRGLALAFMLLKLWPLASDMPDQILAGMRRAAWTVPTVDQRLALWIRQLVEPDDPVMTLGHYHGHMMYLGNPPAVALLSTYHMKSRYGSTRWAPEYLKVLRDRPPKVLVVTDGYWNPFLVRGRFYRPPDQFRASIVGEIKRKYQLVQHSFPGRLLFVRRGLPVSGPGPIPEPSAPAEDLWL